MNAENLTRLVQVMSGNEILVMSLLREHSFFVEHKTRYFKHFNRLVAGQVIDEPNGPLADICQEMSQLFAKLEFEIDERMQRLAAAMEAAALQSASQ